MRYTTTTPEFFLHCQEDDGKCVLKLEGDEAPREFADVLQAMRFVKAMDKDGGAKLTVYDPAGRMMFMALL